MTLRRRDWLAGTAATALHSAGHATAAPRAADGTLRLELAAAETAFDPPQTESSRYTSTVLACILEAPLRYDYLARPVRLQPATAAAMPEVSADFRSITVRIKPGILFSEHPAFRGKPRELVAAD
jgi:ABC-type transport system substrate-binding protein